MAKTQQDANELLWPGADPNVADTSNNTAIHYAAAYGWYHCVSVLLAASANPDVYNDRKVRFDSYSIEASV